MTEALKIDGDDAMNFVARPRLELVDDDFVKKQEMVETLVGQYRADYFGEPGHKGMYDDEQEQFLQYLQTDQVNDSNPILAEAAKKFLTEIGGTDET